MIMYYGKHLLSKVREQKGQGMVEYALIIGLVSIVAIAGLILLGPQIKEAFMQISNKLPTVGTP